MSSSPARYFPGIFTRRNPIQDAPTESADGLAVNGEVTGSVSAQRSSVSRPESTVPNLVPLEQKETKAQMHLVCGRNSDRQSAASFRWKAHLP
jgi:hypothetical protein